MGTQLATIASVGAAGAASSRVPVVISWLAAGVAVTTVVVLAATWLRRSRRGDGHPWCATALALAGAADLAALPFVLSLGALAVLPCLMLVVGALALLWYAVLVGTAQVP